MPGTERYFEIGFADQYPGIAYGRRLQPDPRFFGENGRNGLRGGTAPLAHEPPAGPFPEQLLRNRRRARGPFSG